LYNPYLLIVADQYFVNC